MHDHYRAIDRRVWAYVRVAAHRARVRWALIGGAGVFAVQVLIDVIPDGAVDPAVLNTLGAFVAIYAALFTYEFVKAPVDAKQVRDQRQAEQDQALHKARQAELEARRRAAAYQARGDLLLTLEHAYDRITGGMRNYPPDTEVTGHLTSIETGAYLSRITAALDLGGRPDLAEQVALDPNEDDLRTYGGVLAFYEKRIRLVEEWGRHQPLALFPEPKL